MSTTAVPVPPVLATLIGRLAAAVPGRARALHAGKIRCGGRFQATQILL
jgi:hypothetical protein